MVRLEDLVINDCKLNLLVSIPVWFDWKKHILFFKECDIRGFNSSMVRLEDVEQL